MNRFVIFLITIFSIVHSAFGQDATGMEEMDTELNGDYLEMISGDEITEFYLEGNVTVTGTNLNLKSDELRITMAKEGDTDATIGQMGNIISIIAIGNVEINQKGRSAQSGRAEFFPEQKRVLLTENPLLTELNRTISGEEVEWFYGQRRAQVRGGEQRVAVTLGAVPDFGFDSDAPDPESNNSETEVQENDEESEDTAENSFNPQ
mgnify:CR=1 FL=1